MSAPAIEFERVSKRYVIRHQRTGYLKDHLTGALQRLNPFSRQLRDQTVEDFWALKDVSFRIERGESVGIVGPNGSGKSTTLKILAGVTEQTSGLVSVNGRLGALIEVGAGFHPELSGRENVFLNGSILGMKRADIKRRFDAIVAFAELEKFIDTPVKHYSSGMYVRLGFAIAVHNDPDILLVDEVLAVGDLSFQRKCYEKMQELKNSGKTFILISHAMPQIQSLCQRAIMLRGGRKLADGTPSEVTEIYVQQQGGSTAATQNKAPEKPSCITIVATRLVDHRGNRVTETQPGERIIFEFDFECSEPLPDPIGWIHISRNDVRIYDGDSGNVGTSLGTLRGRGTLRCELPPIPLMPNSYDVQVGIFDSNRQLLASSWNPGLLSITRHRSAAEMGCGWVPESDQRGIFYGRSAWHSSSSEATKAHSRTALEGQMRGRLTTG